MKAFHFGEVRRLIQTFPDGTTVSFGPGSFDEWCVYLHRPGGRPHAPRDESYFARLQHLGNRHGHQTLYDDFVAVYDRTTAEVDAAVLGLIASLTAKYGPDALELAIWFTVIYAGMVAEENKAKAVLKKRIKRLGMHQALVERLVPAEAATFSRGKKWPELARLCRSKGF